MGHGDDYFTIGDVDALKWQQDQLEKTFDMKTAVVGHSCGPGVAKEGTSINRVVRACYAGWEYECDQRHGEVLIEELGLGTGNMFTTSGVEEVVHLRVGVPVSRVGSKSQLHRSG